MKRFLNLLKKQEGFTLVELMVVVAIIGLLSAVAVPNFKKYQAKAKVAEAKLTLANLWTAQQAFFVDYEQYHTCLSAMGFGWGTAENSSRFFSAGFAGTPAITAQGAATSAGLNLTGCPNNASGLGTAAFQGAKNGGGTGHLPTTAISGTGTNFTAGAGGIIDGDFAATTTSSQFTINEIKSIQNVRNGY